jgi:hypothetical protein
VTWRIEFAPGVDKKLRKLGRSAEDQPKIGYSPFCTSASPLIAIATSVANR